jgi:hypothetical protein
MKNISSLLSLRDHNLFEELHSASDYVWKI